MSELKSCRGCGFSGKQIGVGTVIVMSGGFMLNVAEIQENEVLNVGASGVKDDDPGNSILFQSWCRRSERRTMGHRGRMGDGSINNSKGGNHVY